MSGDPMTKAELVQLRYRLMKMNRIDLQNFYSTAHHRCRSIPGYFPKPQDIQELVQAWKAMRKYEQVTIRQRRDPLR